MIYEYFSNISNPFYQLANIRILLQQKKLIKNYFLSLIVLKNVLLLQSNVLQLKTTMETTIVRKPTSFRLRTDLIERLKKNAARSNRTLNNYVESVLLDVVYREPNEETKSAIAEATSGNNSNKIYLKVRELFNDILNEKE